MLGGLPRGPQLHEVSIYPHTHDAHTPHDAHTHRTHPHEDTPHVCSGRWWRGLCVHAGNISESVCVCTYAFRFNPTASKSIKYIKHGQFFLQYADNSNLKGYEATDIVQFGDFYTFTKFGG